MRVRVGLVAILAISASCGKEASPFIAGFEPTPPEAGFTRYVLPVIDGIQPGEDDTWCQYIAPAAAEDQDVLAVTGQQSAQGHHIAIYATSGPLPVGTSRKCLTADQLSLGFLGGIGGEGVGVVFQKLPEGVTFRLHKGWGILANTHFVNTTNKVIQGQGVIDVKFAPESPDRKPLNLFTNVTTNFTMPPSETYSTDVTCTFKQDMQAILVFNHMHELGADIYTELIHPDGTSQMLRTDTPWQREFTFNPDMSAFPLTGNGTLVFHAGDVMHTHCEWKNTSTNSVTFPQEMCVGGAVVLGDREIDCVDTEWDATNSGN